MENFDQPLDAGMDAGGPDRSGLSITPEIRQYWRQTAQWAMFFAVLLFIVYGLIALFGLFAAVKGGVGGLIGALIMVGLYTAIIFMPAWYYYKFSTQSKQAMSFDDTAMLDEAFANLRRFYNYVGIMAIIILSLYLLLFLVFGATILSTLGGRGLGE